MSLLDNRPASPGLDDLGRDHVVATPSHRDGLTGWKRRLRRWLHVVDVLAGVLATVVAQLVSPHPLAPPAWGGSLGVVAVLVATVVLWQLSLALSGSYEPHATAQGPDEYRRVLVGSWHYAALLIVATFLIGSSFPRSFVLADVLLGIVFLFGGRHLVRRGLSHERRHGRALHRTLVVGPPYRAAELVNRVNQTGGFRVVGVCISGGRVADGMTHDLPTIGSVDFGDVAAAVARTGADTVAVVGEHDLSPGFVSELAWHLEGSDVDLMVSPTITDIAGPRIRIRPVGQLPMLYVESPHARRMPHRIKAAVDPVIAAGLLLLIAPVLLAIALLIKLDSPGPVFFRQQRAGLNASYFRIWKFRTMRQDAEKLAAEAEFAQLLDDGRGKVANDPRITRLGRFLRKTSLDELPQLINVVQGTMSLVGPRPVPADLDTFEKHELRRLLVRPGMTGLWQVSGRSDIDWHERVRLDLHYVENWSPLLDLVILLRTVSVVFRGNGAY